MSKQSGFDLAKAANFDIQGAINEALNASHADQFVKSATYLPNDAPAPPGLFVVSITSPEGEKIEIAVEPANALVGLLGNLILKAK